MRHDKPKPVKPLERPYIGRVFLRWSKYWMNCNDPDKRKEYFKQTCMLGQLLEQEVLGKQRE